MVFPQSKLSLCKDAEVARKQKLKAKIFRPSPRASSKPQKFVSRSFEDREREKAKVYMEQAQKKQRKKDKEKIPAASTRLYEPF